MEGDRPKPETYRIWLLPVHREPGLRPHAVPCAQF
jgi:hypothetical protein